MARDLDNRKRLPVWKKAALFVLITAVVGGLLFGLGTAALHLIYPLSYSEQVEKTARENGLPVSLLYAVIYTESHFDEDDVSAAGAVGLMQLTEIAFTESQKKRDGTVHLSPEQRYDPAINICYGGYYLRLMMNRFSCTETALAAYNAGQTRVAGWLMDRTYSDDGETLSYIPYEETKNYVERVLRAQKTYQALYQIE